ncbi:MAG: YlxR family protein [Actinomycetota bacterium]
MPTRTCVGCRLRTDKSDLLRVVAVRCGAESERISGRTWCVVPDPRGRLPGRGAYLHPDPGCLSLAERRRAFPRALRLPGPLDTTALRRWFAEWVGGQAGGDAT